MNGPINLTPDEITEITGAVRLRTQASRLRAMGLTYLVRPDGRPLVARAHYLRMMGATDTDQHDQEPDFGTIA